MAAFKAPRAVCIRLDRLMKTWHFILNLTIKSSDNCLQKLSVTRRHACEKKTTFQSFTGLSALLAKDEKWLCANDKSDLSACHSLTAAVIHLNRRIYCVTFRTRSLTQCLLVLASCYFPQLILLLKRTCLSWPKP